MKVSHISIDFEYYTSMTGILVQTTLEKGLVGVLLVARFVIRFYIACQISHNNYIQNCPRNCVPIFLRYIHMYKDRYLQNTDTPDIIFAIWQI